MFRNLVNSMKVLSVYGLILKGLIKVNRLVLFTLLKERRGYKGKTSKFLTIGQQ